MENQQKGVRFADLSLHDRKFWTRRQFMTRAGLAAGSAALLSACSSPTQAEKPDLGLVIETVIHPSARERVQDEEKLRELIKTLGGLINVQGSFKFEFISQHISEAEFVEIIGHFGWKAGEGTPIAYKGLRESKHTALGMGLWYDQYGAIIVVDSEVSGFGPPDPNITLISTLTTELLHLDSGTALACDAADATDSVKGHSLGFGVQERILGTNSDLTGNYTICSRNTKIDTQMYDVGYNAPGLYDLSRQVLS